NLLALLNCRSDHTERGAVSGRCERTRVAMCEDSTFARHERCTVASHGLVGGDVLGVHALRFFDQRLPDLRQWPNANPLKLFLHALDRPEQIDRCWTRLADDLARLVEILL